MRHVCMRHAATPMSWQTLCLFDTLCIHPMPRRQLRPWVAGNLPRCGCCHPTPFPPSIDAAPAASLLWFQGRKREGPGRCRAHVCASPKCRECDLPVRAG